MCSIMGIETKKVDFAQLTACFDPCNEART